MDKIIWGMPTLLELDSIEENIDLCRSMNLSFVEINMNLPQYQPNQIDIERFKVLKDQNDIFYTIHLPEEFDIANFNDDVRASYEKIFTDTVEIAKQLDVRMINMHMNMGVYFKMPTEKIYLYEKYMHDYLGKIRRFAALCERLLKDTGIRLAIENTGIYDLEYIRSAVNELISKDIVCLTWDIGHDYSSGNKDFDYIMINRSKLSHMHFHDAIGKNNHLPLFTGEIDIPDRINIAMEHGCCCVIETKTVEGLKKSVENLNANS